MKIPRTDSIRPMGEIDAGVKRHSDTQARLDKLNRAGLVDYYMTSFGMTKSEAEGRADSYLRAKQARQSR